MGHIKAATVVCFYVPARKFRGPFSYSLLIFQVLFYGREKEAFLRPFLYALQGGRHVIDTSKKLDFCL